MTSQPMERRNARGQLPTHGTGPAATLGRALARAQRHGGGWGVITSADRRLAALVGACTTGAVAIAAGEVGFMAFPDALLVAAIAALGMPVAALIGWRYTIAFRPGETLWLAVGLAIMACELGNLEIWGGLAIGSLASGDPSGAASAALFALFGVGYSLIALPVTVPTTVVSVLAFRRLREHNSPGFRRWLMLGVVAEVAVVVLGVLLVGTGVLQPRQPLFR